MKTGPQLPLFDGQERSLFFIEDSRERADSLRDLLVPKLLTIHQFAINRVGEVYHCDPQEGSSKKPSISPDHRKSALNTKDFHAASVGLVGAQVGGKYISPRLILLLSSEGLRTVFWLNKEKEAGVFDQVFRQHGGSIRSLFASMEQPAIWAGLEALNFADSEVLQDLLEVEIAALDQFWHIGLCGRLHVYPINVENIAERLTADFVALFPIYKTLVDILHGGPDPFPAMFERFENWRRNLGESLTLAEGEARRSYRQHRKREKRLRIWKIKEALAGCDGRLRCEVPGCGFDFFEVYGEIGREFAHVHHLDPLGGREESKNTSLADLAIVCANCHAMIHRHQKCRPLQDLIVKGRDESLASQQEV